MRVWAYLATAIGFEVVGTLSLRASLEHRGWIAVTVVGYLVALTMLGLTLREQLPIGVAYGIWSAVGVALIAALGVLIFNEQLSAGTVLGIVLVVLGVVLVQSGSARATPDRAR